MSQQIQTYSITAPGFYGLNSTDASLDLASGFALTANNCVIDQYGRIGARKGWTAMHSTLAALGTSDIKAIGCLILNDGTEYTVAAGNNKLFKLASGVLTELTYGGGGVAPTITDSHWQMATLNGILYLYQLGHDPLIFDPGLSTTQYRRLSERGGYTGTAQKGNCVISAYGRLWTANTTTDKVTIQFSDIKFGYLWTAGSSGTLDVTSVWPRGGDNIVGLAAHNGFLFIFGRSTILVYQGATNPSTMTLADTVLGVGCVARDSIQNTDTDVIFLSDSGVRSVLRTVQEKSAPMRDLSRNVNRDIMVALGGETLANIKSCYSPLEGFYLVTFPLIDTTYCFDTKKPLPDGSARATTWDGITPSAFCRMRDETILVGQAGYVGEYTGYTDNGSSYRLQYFTNHTDLGAPSVTSILKKLSVVVVGGSDQYVTMKWAYDFTGNFRSQNVHVEASNTGYYNEAEYGLGEFSNGVSLSTLVAYPTGSGKVVQTGYEADINGSGLSIQKIEILAKNGKVT